MKRVHGKPKFPSQANSGARGCLECGKPLLRSARAAEFCGNTCRSAWNNRRKQRGVILYDLYMATRYDREAAVKSGAWTRMSTAVSNFRAEDIELRARRRSWRRTEDVVGDQPHLFVRVQRV